MRTLICVAVSFLSLSAFAVDPSSCPEAIGLRVSNITAYSRSVADGMEGWAEARDTLRANSEDRELTLKLVGTQKTTCSYKAVTGERATILSVKLNDPELPDPTYADFLLLNLPIKGIDYSLFLAIDEMSKSGLVLYHSTPTERSRVRTKLPRESDGKLVNVDIGLARADVL